MLGCGTVLRNWEIFARVWFIGGRFRTNFGYPNRWTGFALQMARWDCCLFVDSVELLLLIFVLSYTRIHMLVFSLLRVHIKFTWQNLLSGYMHLRLHAVNECNALVKIRGLTKLHCILGWLLNFSMSSPLSLSFLILLLLLLLLFWGHASFAGWFSNFCVNSWVYAAYHIAVVSSNRWANVSIVLTIVKPIETLWGHLLVKLQNIPFKFAV